MRGRMEAPPRRPGRSPGKAGIQILLAACAALLVDTFLGAFVLLTLFGGGRPRA